MKRMLKNTYRQAALTLLGDEFENWDELELALSLMIGMWISLTIADVLQWLGYIAM